MPEISVDQVITLHAAIIAKEGGDRRILSEGNLYQMVFRANLIPDTLSRAAFILYSLAAYPAFREGNKPVAWELAIQVLADGGYSIDPSDSAHLDRMVEGILSFTTEIEDIEAWMSAHARKR
jgi:prophage maintenance system killer protein